MRRFSILWIIAVLTEIANAVPVNTAPFVYTQTDGTTVVVYPHGDENYHYYTNAAGERLIRDYNKDFVVDSLCVSPFVAQRASPCTVHRASNARRLSAFGRAPFLVPKGLVILVEFTDVTFQAVNPPSAIDSMMNGTDYHYDGATGSVRQYFIDQSAGQYVPEFTVVGPVTLPHPYKFYGENDANGYDKHLADLVIDACLAADSLADFSEIDFDKDGYVDFVYLLYAGYGEADSGNDDLIWPCNWDLDVTIEEGYSAQTTYTPEHLPQLDGKFINSYACSNCLRSSGQRAGIGNVCHEYSHVIGLPDLYDVYYGTNYSGYLTPSKWHLMDQGAYNNGGKTPPSYSPWDKYFFGWATPTLLTPSCHDTLPSDGKTYRYFCADGLNHEAQSPEEIYYIENRQQTGWDAYCPGHGMLVWRVKYDADIWAANEPNASESKEFGKPIVNTTGAVNYSLIPSVGAKITNSSRDPYPGANNEREFDAVKNCVLNNIQEKNGLIIYSVTGGGTTGKNSVEQPAITNRKIYDILGRYYGTDTQRLRPGMYIFSR